MNVKSPDAGHRGFKQTYYEKITRRFYKYKYFLLRTSCSHSLFDTCKYFSKAMVMEGVSGSGALMFG